MTISKVEVDPSAVFECAQVYVALSRAPSLDSLALPVGRPLRKELVKAHSMAVAFNR